jgi:hypothetical protein
MAPFPAFLLLQITADSCGYESIDSCYTVCGFRRKLSEYKDGLLVPQAGFSMEDGNILSRRRSFF